MTDPLSTARGRLAYASRIGDPDEMRLARREFNALKLERTIRSTLETEPGLSPSQRNHLARVLTSGGAR